MRIGIDLMGSDRSPQELFEAILPVARKHSATTDFHFFITADLHKTLLEEGDKLPFIFHEADSVIAMTDDPVRSLREKPNSTLLQGIKALKKRAIDLFMTAGNTGALISASALFLPKQEGIKRPALLATLPSLKGPVVLIDAGGNVQMKPALIRHYAEMGLEHAKRNLGKKSPSLALLNVGVESKKGTKEHQEAFEKLIDLKGFKGNIEPQAVFQGEADVIVTDGFSGNILLKTAEGVSSFIFSLLKAHVEPSMAADVDKLVHRLEQANFPGAYVMGVKGSVIKIHGSAGGEAFSRCLEHSLAFPHSRRSL